MRIKLLENLPFWIVLAGLYNLVLSAVGINYLYAGLYIVGIVLSFFGLMKKGEKVYDLIIIFFIVFLLINSYITLFIKVNTKISVLLSGLAIYLLPIIFWTFYLQLYKDFDFKKIINKLKFHILLIALIGLVQYYFSPDLFGLLAQSRMIEWATQQGRESYVSFFRASSILGSPQIFGGFLSLYIIAFISYNQKVDLYKNAIFLIVFFVAGLHAGNKSFIAILIIFLLCQAFFLKKNIFAILLTGFSFFLVFFFFEDFQFINRIFSDNVLQQEQEGRLQIWTGFLDSITFFGGGAGSFMNLELSGNNNSTESFILQILVELGFIPFILFILLFINRFLFNNFVYHKIMLIVIIFFMIIVHAFNSPAFILFWGILLTKQFRNKQYPLHTISSTKTNENSENSINDNHNKYNYS